MKITADTNVLIRAAVQDDPHQARVAAKLMRDAQLVAVPIAVLCEFAWVLRRGYDKPTPAIADSIRLLICAPNVAVDRPAVEAGLAALDAGGDFADGVIAYQGQWLGGQEFATFDKKAAALLRSQGHSVRLLR